MLNIFTYTLSDLLSIINVLLLINIIEKDKTKAAFIKYLICMPIFILFSILYYIIFFNIYNPIINIYLLVISYVRFPIMAKVLKNYSFLKGVYIVFLISQLCDSIHLIIYNILKNYFLSFDEALSKCLVLIGIKLVLTIAMLVLQKNADLTKIKNAIKLIPIKIYILIAINILLMGAITSITGYDLSTESNVIKQVSLTNIILLLIFIISIIITVSLISNCVSKTYYNSVNSILEKQIENQIEYYNQTDMLNSDLRRFKHDYTNHILCLKAMINSNQNNEALEYIEKINSEISLSTQTFNTGHKIADAILNEKHRIHSDINIKFEGCIPQFIDNVDLCIVLGNAVDNAIEACEKLNETDKIIDITVNYQQSHFILIIKNPVAKDYIINGSFPETTKADPLKHGFGLSNIKHIANKYEGDMSVKAGNGTFTLYLALKVNQGE